MAKVTKGDVSVRMKIANDKLAVARFLLEKEYYNDTVSKAYYAMFYVFEFRLTPNDSAFPS